MIVSLIGDYSAQVDAHQAIPRAIELAADSLELDVGYEWIRTTRVDDTDLAESDAVWCVPTAT